MYTGRIINGTVEGLNVQDIDRIVTNGQGQPIDLCLNIVNHSPTGFCWGYAGSGPAQLAFAILYDYLKDRQRAMGLYHDFKMAVIARLKMDEDFVLTDQQIENFITAAEIARMRS